MTGRHGRRFGGIFLGVVLMVAYVAHEKVHAQIQKPQRGVPQFELDKNWPKPWPANWVVGEIVSVNVDSRDHVWILQRPKTVKEGEVTGTKLLAPPVIELDNDGNVVQAWGGPGEGYTWMERSTAQFPYGSNAEHGIFIDNKDNVWVAGNGHVVLKFTRTGKFLLQIGQLWKTGGSHDTRLLGNPCDIAVNPQTNEVFVADGYVNHRVIVFDADTGAYKRHWGAYGKTPSDDFPERYDPNKPLPTQFYAVHCLQIARDGLVYVCDRQRNRVQVFQPDGTFVKEVRIAKETPADRRGSDQPNGTGGSGSAFRVGFSADPEQRYLYVDSSFGKVWILNRKDLEILGSFDGNAGHHMGGADSKGNLYGTGGRIPKRFLFKGVPTS